MHIQQAVEHLEERLEDQVGLCSDTKDERFFLLSLWKFLKRLSEQYPSLLLLPCVERGDWRCEAILLSHGGVYVFHLLPINMIEIEVQCFGIKVLYGNKGNMDEDGNQSHEVFYPFGKSRRVIEALQKQMNESPLSVYEFYIASEHYPDLRCAVEGKLIIAISQLDDLFSRYEFRFDPRHEHNQKELYQCLSQWQYRVESEIKQSTKDEKESDRTALDVYTDSEAAPVQKMTLPPRQSRKKKHSHSWLHKFLNGK